MNGKFGILRIILAVVLGCVAWFALATIGNLILRTWPDYAQGEPQMRFTLAMMVARLGLSALSSVQGGVVAAIVARGNPAAAVLLGVVLTAMFIPVHVGLWDKFPLAYHATFLVSLLPLTLLGHALVAGRFKVDVDI